MSITVLDLLSMTMTMTMTLTMTMKLRTVRRSTWILHVQLYTYVGA